MAKQKVKTTIKGRRKKSKSGYKTCNICHGTGRVKK